MPTLKQILSATMTHSARVSTTTFKELSAKDGLGLDVLPPLPLPNTSALDEDAAHAKGRALRVWAWRHSASGSDLARIKALRCWPRSMNYAMDITVCDEIAWGNVHIRRLDLQGDEVRHELPLSTTYLVSRTHHCDGEIGERDVGLWRLATRTDSGLLLVFAYKLPDGAGEPDPVPEAERSRADFMPTQGSGAADPLRVVVCCELVACKEAKDFEPLGVASLARIRAHVMVMASQSLIEATSTIRIARPKTSSHNHTPGYMLNDIGAAYFADTNTYNNPLSPPLPPTPHWPNLFDYYDVDPKVGRSLAMVVDRAAGPSTNTGAVQRLGSFPTFSYADATIVRAAGQGSFDSVHMAPKMTAPPIGGASATAWKMDRVTMAPVCVHDCLHLHWRWGAMYSLDGFESLFKSLNFEVPLRRKLGGWSDDFEPNQVVGAPLIPPNQRLTITRTDASTIVYEATARDCVPGRWEVFFHHGMAYAVMLDEDNLLVQTMMAVAVQTIPPFERAVPWTQLYWNLRWCNDPPLTSPGSPRPIERIRLVRPSEVITEAAPAPTPDGDPFTIHWTSSFPGGFTLAIPYSHEGKAHVALYSRDQHLAHGYRLGTRGRMDKVWEEPWTNDWTHAMPYSMKVDGKQRSFYFLYDTVSGRLEFGAVNASGRLKELNEIVALKGSTSFMPFEFEGSTWFAVYKSGTGSVGIGKIKPDGSGTEDQPKRQWSKGWTSFMPFRIGKSPRYLIYKAESGRAEYGELIGPASKMDWEPAAPQETWNQTDINLFVPYAIGDKPTYVAHRSSTGDTWIARIEADGHSETELFRGAWRPIDAIESGWDIIAPMQSGSRLFLFLYSRDTGMASVRSCSLSASVGKSTLSAGFARMVDGVQLSADFLEAIELNEP